MHLNQNESQLQSMNRTMNLSNISENNKSKGFVRKGEATDPKTIYKNIFKKIEQLFIENSEETKMLATFRNEIIQSFKIQIAFDSTIIAVLRSLYKENCEYFRGTHNFLNKIKFFSKMNELLYSQHFILYREYIRFSQVLRKEEESPANMWLEYIDYLKNADDIQEFRMEFLTRYCGISEEQCSTIFQQLSEQNALQRIKEEYTNFFKKSITDDVDIKVVTFVEDVFSQKQNKSEMLPLKLIRDLEKKLGTNVGSSDKEIQINRELVQIAQRNAHHNDHQAQQRLEYEVNLLQKSLQKFSGLKLLKQKKIALRLGKFGSLISGFAGIDADLDLTILTNSYVKELEFLQFLLEFLKRDYKIDDRQNGRRISIQIIRANTPLIAVKIYNRGQNEIKIDIIVNNVLGVINSKFLGVYAQIRWIKNLGLLVKMWAKKINLIDKSNLSSYAMILMLIHYLIHSKKVKAILDNRVTTVDTPHFTFKRVKQGLEEIFDVNYMFKTDPRHVTTYERVNYFQVLKGFMQYYAEQFWKQDEGQRIVTVDQSYDKNIEPDCAITIKDPFDKPHNPGRMNVSSLDFLKQKFKDGYELLKSEKQDRIKDMFE